MRINSVGQSGRHLCGFPAPWVGSRKRSVATRLRAEARQGSKKVAKNYLRVGE